MHFVDQLNTTIPCIIKKPAYELVFGQPPRQTVFHGASGERIMEDVEDLFDDINDEISSDPVDNSDEPAADNLPTPDDQCKI